MLCVKPSGGGDWWKQGLTHRRWPDARRVGGRFTSGGARLDGANTRTSIAIALAPTMAAHCGIVLPIESLGCSWVCPP
jgi:hypothetical protein